MYVARSSRIIDIIRRSIMKMRDAELASYIVTPSAHDATELANRLLWEENLHLLPQLPKDWLTRVRPADVEIEVVDHRSKANPPQLLTTVAFPASCGVVLPPVRHDTPHWHRPGEPRIMDIDVDSVAHLAGAADLKAAIALALEEEEVRAKWTKVEADIVKLLRSSSSLNEAVRLVPSIKLYLPQDLRDQLDRKAEPVKRLSKAEREAALIGNLDTDALAAAAVHGTFLVNSN